jgi:hypothetical protein
MDLVIRHPLLALLGDDLHAARLGRGAWRGARFDADDFRREQRLEDLVILVGLAQLDVLLGDVHGAHGAQSLQEAIDRQRCVDHEAMLPDTRLSDGDEREEDLGVTLKT